MDSSNNINPQGTALTADDSSTPSSPSQIPDLMKIGASPVNTNMDVETDILDSVVLNETFCRFRLQNKGILHSNSKIAFSVNVADTTDTAFFPINIGVNSLIERCVLKSGTKTICETNDFNHFSAFRSTFINPQHNKHRESVGTGRLMCRKWEYNDGANASSASGAGTGISDTSAVKYSLDTDIEINRKNLAVGHRKYDIPEYVKLNGFSSASATKESPVFQIALNDLFPFLKMNQLPLYLFKEEIDIELYFAKSDRRCCVNGTDIGTYTIDKNEVKMIADYIFYPQEMMEAYANANKKMSFTYVDYRLVKRTVDASAGGATDIIYNIGGAGRVVNKVFFSLENSSESSSGALAQKSLYNYYTSTGINVNKSGDASADMGVISHNLRYNDNYLYPIDIKNNARIFHNIALAEGSTPFISKDEYSREQGLVSSELVLGHNFNTNTTGNFYWTEDRLNRNERVNSRGIELYQTWNELPASVYTLRVWLETIKMAVLSDGVLTCVYA